MQFLHRHDKHYQYVAESVFDGKERAWQKKLESVFLVLNQLQIEKNCCLHDLQFIAQILRDENTQSLSRSTEALSKEIVIALFTLRHIDG